MFDVYTLSVIIFFTILAVLIYRDRKKVQFQYILIMRRTKRFRDFIDYIARKSPRFWKLVATLGVIICFFYMFNTMYALALVTGKIAAGEIKKPALEFVVPVPTPQPTGIPGVIGIPFWFWILTVAAILIPHEFFHGVIARAEKIPLQSVGLLLLVLSPITLSITALYFIFSGTFDPLLLVIAVFMIIPGAFVEPNEKILRKAKLIKRLRVLAAGSLINIVIGLSLLVVSQNFIWPSIVQPGLMITYVNQSAPAGLMGLKPGMILEEINKTPMKMGFGDYAYVLLSFKLPNSTSQQMPQHMSSLLFLTSIANFTPGNTTAIKVDGKYYNITFDENPSEKNFPYMGIRTTLNTKRPEAFEAFLPILAFVSMLSFLVGIFNVLPIYPLDGGLMVEALADRFGKKNSRRIVKALTYITLLILIYGFIGPVLPR